MNIHDLLNLLDIFIVILENVLMICLMKHAINTVCWIKKIGVWNRIYHSHSQPMTNVGGSPYKRVFPQVTGWYLIDSQTRTVKICQSLEVPMAGVVSLGPTHSQWSWRIWSPIIPAHHLNWPISGDIWGVVLWFCKYYTKNGCDTMGMWWYV